MTDTIAMFSRLPELFARQPALVCRARLAHVTLLLGAGPDSLRVRLAGGTLDTRPSGGPMDGWDLALRGDDRVWPDHWARIPAPDAADIFGMRRHGRLTIEGDFLGLMRSLQVVKDILALPRGLS